MTEIQKIIALLLKEIIAQIDNKNSSIISQKELDNTRIPSIHTDKKGVEND